METQSHCLIWPEICFAHTGNVIMKKDFSTRKRNSAPQALRVTFCNAKIFDNFCSLLAANFRQFCQFTSINKQINK